MIPRKLNNHNILSEYILRAYNKAIVVCHLVQSKDLSNMKFKRLKCILNRTEDRKKIRMLFKSDPKGFFNTIHPFQISQYP